MSTDNKKGESATPKVPVGMPDLNALRLPQDFAANHGVKKLLVQVPVTRPHKGWFSRSRPGAEWRTQVAMIELREEGENYVVHPDLAADLPDEVRHFELVTAINRHGTVFLWQLRRPNSQWGDSWADSAIAACTHAETQWVKVGSNRQASAYEVAVATALWHRVFGDAQCVLSVGSFRFFIQSVGEPRQIPLSDHVTCRPLRAKRPVIGSTTDPSRPGAVRPHRGWDRA